MRKKNIITKILSLLLVLVAATTTCSNVYAKDNSVEVEIIDQWTVDTDDVTIGNYNVATTPPENDNLVTYGITAPNTYINLNDGPLEFKGESTKGYDLYTNDGFKGKERVLLVVTNYREEPLTVKLKTIAGITVKTITVPADAGQATSITGLNTILGYYLMFVAPCHMEGSVS